MRTPRRFSARRCTQPVVLPSSRPGGVGLRCSSQTSRGDAGFRCGREAAAGARRHVDAPLAHECRDVEAGRRMGRIVTQELGDVEADAAGADDRDRPPDRRAAQEHVDVAQHLRMVEARDRRARAARCRWRARPRRTRRSRGRRPSRACPRRTSTPVSSSARAEVAQRLVELLLARNALRQVELAADLRRRPRTASRDGRARPATVAQARPAGPAPTTAMRFGAGAGR